MLQLMNDSTVAFFDLLDLSLSITSPATRIIKTVSLTPTQPVGPLLLAPLGEFYQERVIYVAILNGGHLRPPNQRMDIPPLLLHPSSWVRITIAALLG